MWGCAVVYLLLCAKNNYTARENEVLVFHKSEWPFVLSVL